MDGITDSRYIVNKFLKNRIIKCIQSTSSKCVLDVGCGKKPYMRYFPNTTMYIGIDKSTPSADVIAVGEYLPFRNKAFDTVICTQVLEHVEDPVRVLKEMNRILQGRGVLILSTHGFWIEGHERTDYWRWTLQGLYRILSQTGFDVIESYSMEPYSSFFQFISLFIPTNLIGKLFQTFINLLCGLAIKILRDRGVRLHAVHVIKAMRRPYKND